MFKIGDFSKLSQVSIKALRLYDRLELLKPARVDDLTGYRYYSACQLPRLHRILVFKELGFSLEQIGHLLNDRVKVYELPGVDRMACIVHHGSYRTITSAYNLLLKWIEENAYHIVGASRELYIYGGAERDNESYITEIQFPIANG